MAFVIGKLKRIDWFILMNEKIIPDYPIFRPAVKFVSNPGDGVFDIFGRIINGFLKINIPEDDFSYDFTFMRYKCLFTFYCSNRIGILFPGN